MIKTILLISTYVKESTMIGNILNLSYKEYQKYVKNNS